MLTLSNNRSMEFVTVETSLKLRTVTVLSATKSWLRAIHWMLPFPFSGGSSYGFTSSTKKSRPRPRHDRIDDTTRWSSFESIGGPDCGSHGGLTTLFVTSPAVHWIPSRWWRSLGARVAWTIAPATDSELKPPGEERVDRIPAPIPDPEAGIFRTATGFLPTQRKPAFTPLPRFSRR
jgi:hypothetical protein